MKGKKKYCLNMSSYKFQYGFNHLLPPIILKESNNLNINIENIISFHNKCPCGKKCPNFELIIELKHEIIKLIDKIIQLKKINEYNKPTIPHPKSNITPEKEKKGGKYNNNIYNQLINSFRNSSKKNKLIEIKNNSNKNNIFKSIILNLGTIKLRPNSTKSSYLKESYGKLFIKERIKTDEKKENENNLSNNKKKINLNFFSSSSRKRNENSLNNKIIKNNQRYENNSKENNSNSKILQFFNHQSFTSLRKSKINELSSLNFLSNSIISPAIKIIPKNLFDSLKANKINKGNKTFEEKKIIFN